MAGSVELRLEAGGRDVGLRSEACSPNSLWAAARPRSVGPWTGEASYSRGSPCRRLTAFTRVRFDVSKITVSVTVRYRSDSVSITVFITVSLPFHYPFTVRRKRNVDFFLDFYCICICWRFLSNRHV